MVARGLAQNIPPKMPSDIFGGLRWIPYCSELDTVKRPITVDLDKDKKMQNGFAEGRAEICAWLFFYGVKEFPRERGFDRKHPVRYRTRSGIPVGSALQPSLHLQ